MQSVFLVDINILFNKIHLLIKNFVHDYLKPSFLFINTLSVFATASDNMAEVENIGKAKRLVRENNR